MQTSNILVVGGGIGGLTAAHALRSAGFAVTLVEKAPAFAPVGAGIILAANAASILEALGIAPESVGKPMAGLHLQTASGAMLHAAEMDSLPQRYATSFALHRADLHALLLAGLEDVPMHMGTTVTAVEAYPDGVSVALSDGSQATWDLVLGADGIHSRVRALLYGTDEPALAYSGYSCWRFVCPNPGIDAASEVWGRGQRVGLVPLTRERLYVFLVMNAPRGTVQPRWPDALCQAYAGFPEPVQQVLRAAQQSNAEVVHHDLFDLARHVWGNERIWLLGDAAHAVLPNLGQGAAMAIEDAFALASALCQGADFRQAHAGYVSVRSLRVRRVWKQSRLIGSVAQWQNPVASWFRNELVRMTPVCASRRRMTQLLEPGVALAERAFPPDESSA